MPTKFAKTADRLTSIDIEKPDNIEKDTILSWLEYDARGFQRPDSGYVTYGAVEYDSTYGVRQNNFDILVLPNPADREFFIIFDNPETQKIKIELVDLQGKNILDVHEGIVSIGYQVYKVDNKLSSGTYFVKMMFSDEMIVRKVVVDK
jgi:hypothetical protein